MFVLYSLAFSVQRFQLQHMHPEHNRCDRVTEMDLFDRKKTKKNQIREGRQLKLMINKLKSICQHQ